MNLLSWIGASRPVQLVLAIGAGLLGLWLYGRRKAAEGRQHAQDEHQAQILRAVETRRDVENDLRGRAGTARERVRRKWTAPR